MSFVINRLDGQNLLSVCLSHRTKPVICLPFAPDKTCYLCTHRTKPVICLSYAQDKTCHLSVFCSGQNQSSVCLSLRTKPIICLSFVPGNTSHLSVFRSGQNQLSVCLSHRTKPIICLSFAPDTLVEYESTRCDKRLFVRFAVSASSNSHLQQPPLWASDPFRRPQPSGHDRRHK